MGFPSRIVDNFTCPSLRCFTLSVFWVPKTLGVWVRGYPKLADTQITMTHGNNYGKPYLWLFIIIWCGFFIMCCSYFITLCGFFIICCSYSIMFCGFFIMSCNVVLTWCVLSWCGVITSLRGVVLLWCIEVVKLCLVLLSWCNVVTLLCCLVSSICGLTITWCGFVYMSSWPHFQYQALVPKLLAITNWLNRFLDGSQFLLFPGVKDNKMARTSNDNLSTILDKMHLRHL